MCKEFFGRYTHKRKWGGSQARLRESSDHDADLTLSKRQRDWRFPGSILLCPASKGSSARPSGSPWAKVSHQSCSCFYNRTSLVFLLGWVIPCEQPTGSTDSGQMLGRISEAVSSALCSWRSARHNPMAATCSILLYLTSHSPYIIAVNFLLILMYDHVIPLLTLLSVSQSLSE